MANVPATDHAGLTVLTLDECAMRLRSGRVGRVAFHISGEVEIFPVNYTLDGTSVAFRTAVGSKLTAALEHAAIAFEIDGFDVVRRSGWSVVVKGTCEEVLDSGAVSRLEATGVGPWLDAPAQTRWVSIRAYSVTGRRITAPGS